MAAATEDVGEKRYRKLLAQYLKLQGHIREFLRLTAAEKIEAERLRTILLGDLSEPVDRY